MNGILEQVNGPKGYAVIPAFNDSELETVREVIGRQWLSTITREYELNGMEEYHKFRHEKVWQKKSRIFSREDVEKLLSLPFFRSFAGYEIADLEGIGYPEIYWRLVRPGKDTGPIHADSWFWKITNDIEDCSDMLKVWVPVFIQRGISGLGVVPGSHLTDWPHSSEIRDGRPKPKIDRDASEDLELVRMSPGEAVVFHADILHGGADLGATKTRVSFEFAIKKTS